MTEKINSAESFVDSTEIIQLTKVPVKDPAANGSPTDDSSRLSGTDLFSLFTASIIKEQVVFTR